MSYYDAIIRAAEKQKQRARKIERDAKRAKLFAIVETLDDVEFDESEVFELSEAQTRYAIAH
jgi:hypothetical protein